MRARALVPVCVLGLTALLPACDSGPPEPTPEEIAAELEARIGRALDASMAGIRAEADSVDELLDPVPFLGPSERSGLRAHLAGSHLARARALGARPDDSEHLERLVADGRLVELRDTTAEWSVRRLEHSAPYVTPATRDLLVLLGRRFQDRLVGMGLPAFRLEITSVLRTPADQAELRRVNPNAAVGTSAHEFGTTVDVAWSAFTAPVDPVGDVSAPDLEWLTPRLHRVADAMAERVAGRRSGELGAILGRVLREMQDEGLVLVTREAQQPVFHLTVAGSAGGR